MSLPEFLLPSPVCCGPHPTNHVVLCFFPCLFFFSALRASLGKRRLRLGSRWGENSKTTDRITQDTARVQSSKIERVKVKFGSSAPCASCYLFHAIVTKSTPPLPVLIPLLQRHPTAFFGLNRLRYKFGFSRKEICNFLPQNVSLKFRNIGKLATTISFRFRKWCR